VVLAAQGLDGLERSPLGAPGVVGDTEVDVRAHQVGPEQAQLPSHDGAPVVPHHEHLRPASRARNQGKAISVELVAWRQDSNSS
jgi:hypothetical protein